MDPRIEIVLADITRLAVDAIVNAANRSLRGGGGVDGAIHRAAGPELVRESAALAPCETGDAVITSGYHLPARYVIHTVGPVWQGGGHNEAALLASCYRRSLEVAAAHGLQTIAFPSISTGAFGYPVQPAARIALETVAAFLRREPRIERVLMVCYSQDVVAVYRSAAKEIDHAPN